MLKYPINDSTTSIRVFKAKVILDLGMVKKALIRDNFYEDIFLEHFMIKLKEEKFLMAENKKTITDVRSSCIYFTKPGKENTQPTLDAAFKRAEEAGVDQIIIASTSGETGLEAARMFQGKKVVVVSHSTGFIKPDFQQMKAEYRRLIEESGARIVTCQHALGGVGRAVRKKFKTYQLEEIIAATLRLFGQGTKVAVEIALMAADAGLVTTQALCVSIGGTNDGADTALLLKPAHAQDFFDLKIMEFIAKPRDW